MQLKYPCSESDRGRSSRKKEMSLTLITEGGNGGNGSTLCSGLLVPLRFPEALKGSSP